MLVRPESYLFGEYPVSGSRVCYASARIGVAEREIMAELPSHRIWAKVQSKYGA